MTYDQAAGLFVTYPTSYEALVGRAQLQPGEWVLVHAAAGGVGLCAVQIAKAKGAKVIATAGSKEKLEIAKKYGGADEVLNYRENGDLLALSPRYGSTDIFYLGWQKEVLRITGGKGAGTWRRWRFVSKL